MSQGPAQQTFLTAHWGNLLLLNYPVPVLTLKPFLPRDCELDLFGGAGPFVSLVAFQFTQTRVFGIRWPFYTNFPELNLRFYVKYQGRRAVCFVREYVPSALVSGIARCIYNEPYQKAWMREEVRREEGKIFVRYELRRNSHSLEFCAAALDQPFTPSEDSLEHFFKEHDLGVGRDRSGNTVTYEVQHQVWRVFPVEKFSVRIDAGGIYGPSFSFLEKATPTSVVLAEGSAITVFGKNGSRRFGMGQNSH